MEYIPNTPDDHKTMLATICVERVDDLLREIPEAIRLRRPLTLPPPLTELEVRREIGVRIRRIAIDVFRVVAVLGKRRRQTTTDSDLTHHILLHSCGTRCRNTSNTME